MKLIKQLLADIRRYHREAYWEEVMQEIPAGTQHIITNRVDKVYWENLKRWNFHILTTHGCLRVFFTNRLLNQPQEWN